MPTNIFPSSRKASPPNIFFSVTAGRCCSSISCRSRSARPSSYAIVRSLRSRALVLEVGFLVGLDLHRLHLAGLQVPVVVVAVEADLVLPGLELVAQLRRWADLAAVDHHLGGVRGLEVDEPL